MVNSQNNNDLTISKLRHSLHSQIAVIMGYSQLLARKFEEGSDEAKYIEKILKECHTMDTTLDQMKKLQDDLDTNH